MHGDLPFWTPDIDAAQSAHRARFDALFAGDPAVRTAAVCGPMFGASHGLWGTNAIDMLTQPDEWLDDCLADMAAKAADLADRRTYAPAHFEIDALGTHFIDAVFGAKVTFHEGQVWSQELPGHVGDLQMPDLVCNPILQAALNTAAKAVRAGRGRIFVTTPVLSCPVNIGINLFGQRLLEALLDAPGQARHALRIITDVIIGCIRAFRRMVPPDILRTTVTSSRYMPAGYGFIDGCAAQLISAEVYRNFFAPLDAEILSQWPCGGMIHLCGACAQHIPTWREMEELRVIQLNDRATDDLEFYTAGLRPDQIIYVAPTSTYPQDRVLTAAAGRRVVMQCKQQAEGMQS